MTSYRSGQSAFKHSGALGENVVVYMAQAVELSRDYLISLKPDEPAKVKYLHLFCDNLGAIYRCFAGMPGKAQKLSLRFHEAILEVLDTLKHIKLELLGRPATKGSLVTNALMNSQPRPNAMQIAQL